VRRRLWRSEGTAPLWERSDDCGKRNVLYGVQFRSVDCVNAGVCTFIPNIDTFGDNQGLSKASWCQEGHSSHH
jgi:hypothetical protein